jgi:hypothetical protein
MQAFCLRPFGTSLCDAAIAEKRPTGVPACNWLQSFGGQTRVHPCLLSRLTVKPLERAEARPSRFSLHIFAICLPFRQNE